MKPSTRDHVIGLAVMASAITAGVAAIAGAPYVAGGALVASVIAGTKPWRRQS